MPTLEERIADRDAKKAVKDERRAARRQAEIEQRQEEKRQEAEKKEAKRKAWEEAQERKAATSPNDVD